MKIENGDKAMFWAGGTDMVLHWQREKVSPELCIDLTFLDTLRGIDVFENAIRVGAMASLADLERAAERHHLLRTLSDITKLMCTPQTRSIATVGGNLCNASPAADLSPALVAMNAEADILGGKGERRIPLVDFFEGVNKTALRDGDLLCGIVIPLPGKGRIAGSYRRIDRTVVDIALVNASSCLMVDEEGTIVSTKIALGAVAPVILQCEAAQAKITGKHVNALDQSALAEAGELAAADARPISDVRASADYRRDMVKVMVRRSLGDCIEQLKG